MPMSEPFYTIGHSTRDIDEFIALLHASDIKTVIDVRRLPGSSRYPQFNKDVLADSLHTAGIDYSRAEGLSGRRPVSKTVPFEVNDWWENRSFHNYADHALTDDFQQALSAIRQQACTRRLAVMCSEAVWWRCHRRIIADHLIAHHENVLHILGEHQVKPAQLSPGAVVDAEGMVTYPAENDHPA